MSWEVLVGESGQDSQSISAGTEGRDNNDEAGKTVH